METRDRFSDPFCRNRRAAFRRCFTLVTKAWLISGDCFDPDAHFILARNLNPSALFLKIAATPDFRRAALRYVLAPATI